MRCEVGCGLAEKIRRGTTKLSATIGAERIGDGTDETFRWSNANVILGLESGGRGQGGRWLIALYSAKRCMKKEECYRKKCIFNQTPSEIPPVVFLVGESIQIR